MDLFGADDNDNDDVIDEVLEKESTLADANAIPDARTNTKLLGHDAVEQRLLDWWSKGTMPHTLVLTGPQGIGKASLAFRLARFLLSHPDAPGEGLFGAEPAPETLDVPADSAVFRQVASGGHPDLMTLAREMNDRTGRMGNEILVDAVRTVPNFMRKTASEGGWRIVIVDEAETLNRNAQNALLKILEEPPPKALLILVTQTVGVLVPTIRSRSRVVPMKAPDASVFADLLRGWHPQLTQSDVETLGTVTGNAPGRALALLDQGGMTAIRETMDLLDTLQSVDDGALWTLAEKLAVKSDPDPLAGMLDLSSWALQARARNAAESDAIAAMKQNLQTLDSLERHRAMCENGNLDRRHTALGALRILQKGLKAA